MFNINWISRRDVDSLWEFMARLLVLAAIVCLPIGAVMAIGVLLDPLGLLPPVGEVFRNDDIPLSKKFPGFWWHLGLDLLVIALVVFAITWPILRSARRRIAQRRETHRAQERQAIEAWLASPPPPLDVPERFTDAWFARYVTSMHPQQWPTLVDHLRARGWSEAKIELRVAPYLARNPFLDDRT